MVEWTNQLAFESLPVFALLLQDCGNPLYSWVLVQWRYYKSISLDKPPEKYSITYLDHYAKGPQQQSTTHLWVQRKSLKSTQIQSSNLSVFLCDELWWAQSFIGFKSVEFNYALSSTIDYIIP